jgi:F-type H+-transporting ATPase subunit a
VESIGKVPQLAFYLFGHLCVINIETLIDTWIVMGILLVFAWFAGRNLQMYPSRFQAFVEFVIEGFDKLTYDTLAEKGRKYFPFIMSLFLFVTLSNWIGIIPGLHEPTADMNTTIGLGLIAFIVAQVSAILHKGILGYIKDFFEPMIVIGKWKIPNVFFAPLNMIGEVAKLVSHSFRLFGNIMGGGIIVVVVSSLVYYLLLPIFLSAFFGLFEGLIQAFVFAMLALVYVAIGIVD